MLIAVQICSTLEWKKAKSIRKVKSSRLFSQPFGQYFTDRIGGHRARIFHSGATKTRAAAACQFAIGKWRPGLVINLGTCGGVADDIRKGDLILATKALQYDVIERFGKPSRKFLKGLETAPNFSRVDLPACLRNIRRGTIASADQDIDWIRRKTLKNRVLLAADWESASIAAVCKLNKIQCLILRGVSDAPEKSDAPSGDSQERDYTERASAIMKELFRALSLLRIK